VRYLLLCLLASGCSSECADGICPQAQTVLRPGPCATGAQSTSTDGQGDPDTADGSCTYTWNGNLLVDVVCSNDESLGQDETMFEYSGSDLVEIDVSSESGSPTWTLDATQVTSSYGSDIAIYPRATFSFDTLPGEQISPRADLELASENGVTYSWADTATSRVRTGSDGSVVTYSFDENGHLTEIDNPLETFVWDGDNLVEHDLPSLNVFATYSYDSAGNLQTARSRRRCRRAARRRPPRRCRRRARRGRARRARAPRAMRRR
jgi:hypothetical protein